MKSSRRRTVQGVCELSSKRTVSYRRSILLRACSSWRTNWTSCL